jgi:hypothetical protein
MPRGQLCSPIRRFVHTMLFLNGIDLLIDAVFGVFDLVRNIFAGIVSLLFVALLSRVFHVAPSLLGSALYLVSDSAICKVVIAGRFTNALFHFACNLIDFSCDLILVHGDYSFVLLLLHPTGSALVIGSDGSRG